MGKKKNIGIFCIIIVVQCLVILAWGTQKERLNVDEMFTMEGAGQGGKGMQYWDRTDNFYGSEHTSQEFREYMTVYHDELLIYQGIDSVIDSLLHRNLYYTIINLAATADPGNIPWRVGVGVNLCCFVLAQMALYLIAKEICSDKGALCTVLLYGFSAGAISTVLYVRCYMMLTMLALFLIYLDLRFVRTEKRWEKGLCLVGSAVLAVLCYRLHQFGIILFTVITLLFVFYALVKRKKNCLLWMAAGYGIPALVGAGYIIPQLKRLLTDNIAGIFYTSVKNMTLIQMLAQMIKVLRIVAMHLFVNVGVMILCFAVVLALYVKRKGGRRQERADVFMLCLLTGVVAGYYCILLLGGAVAWKYMSPVYPVIALVFVMWVINVWNHSRKYNIAIMAGSVCLMLSSYDTKHISELFRGEAAIREMLETNYHGVNGIMVHHEAAGENWLYEAATLWPQESKVLVIQNKMLYEDELCYNRTDDKILLWLTIDYDNEKVIDKFKECVDYTDIELVLTTESLKIYECNK